MTITQLLKLNPRFFKQPAEESKTDADVGTITEGEEEKEPEEEKHIICRLCRQIITSPAEILEIQGTHRHTFANPHGLVFEIGCFRTAPGCGLTGPATGEFTWFRGYEWRIALCKTCLNHMGWLFTAADGGRFFGLILDQLVFPPD
jgi:hypothetical protein